jgi:hypothetical protein
MRLLIVPTRWESEVVLGALSDAVPDPAWDVPAWRADDLLIVEPGMGPDLTAVILPRLETLQLGGVWLFGWCGGLRPDLRVGDLVLADATIFARQDSLTGRISHPPPDPLVAQMRRLADRLGLRLALGSVLTSDHLLRSVAQKEAAAATSAVAVEMEAGPLARWSEERSLPFVHIRVVLDPLGLALPSMRLPADQHGRARKGALFYYALANPRDWPALWRLLGQMRIARGVMTDVMEALARPGGPLRPDE